MLKFFLRTCSTYITFRFPNYPTLELMVSSFWKVLATSIAAIGNRTAQMKLASKFVAKMPKALPTKKPIPTNSFAINRSYFVFRFFFEDGCCKKQRDSHEAVT